MELQVRVELDREHLQGDQAPAADRSGVRSVCASAHAAGHQCWTAPAQRARVVLELVTRMPRDNDCAVEGTGWRHVERRLPPRELRQRKRAEPHRWVGGDGGELWCGQIVGRMEREGVNRHASMYPSWKINSL